MKDINKLKFTDRALLCTTKFDRSQTDESQSNDLIQKTIQSIIVINLSKAGMKQLSF